jgi:uncharacterized C2H2 Zn-finger protein
MEKELVAKKPIVDSELPVSLGMHTCDIFVEGETEQRHHVKCPGCGWIFCLAPARQLEVYALERTGCDIHATHDDRDRESIWIVSLTGEHFCDCDFCAKVLKGQKNKLKVPRNFWGGENKSSSLVK